MNIEGLRTEIDRRAAVVAPFHDWDPYILGASSELRRLDLPAGEIASREHARWQVGRFPTIQLAIADAIFSKVRDYGVAVKNCVRPFASAFGEMPLAKFGALGWQDVFEGTFGRKPGPTELSTHHHLSDVGRIQTIEGAAKVFIRLGYETPAQVRAVIAAPHTESAIRNGLARVPGLGPALIAYLLMNLGRMTLKADRHVIRVVAPYLGISPDASPEVFENALIGVAPTLGRTPFEIDQILWYTEADRRPLSTPPQVAEEGPGIQPISAPAHSLTTELPSHSRMVMVGRVLDIQPNRDKPLLELQFSKGDSNALPSTNKSPIDLVIGDVTWSGTLGLTASNPPYVHTNLKAGESKRSMTDILRGLGVKEGGRIEFESLRRGELRFVRIIDAGAWREGSRGDRAQW